MLLDQYCEKFHSRLRMFDKLFSPRRDQMRKWQVTHTHAPSFEQASFEIPAGGQRVSIALHY
jgi:hypothetical protein